MISFKFGVSGLKTLLTCAWVKGSLAEKIRASMIFLISEFFTMIAILSLLTEYLKKYLLEKLYKSLPSQDLKLLKRLL